MRETPVTTCIVHDGAAIVQKLQPAASKTFEEYAQHIVSYMSMKLQTVSLCHAWIWSGILTLLIH